MKPKFGRLDFDVPGVSEQSITFCMALDSLFYFSRSHFLISKIRTFLPALLSYCEN